jgi:serine/threonine protein kinase
VTQDTVASPVFRRLAPSPPTLRGYEVLELIGEGGMGSVYRARHVDLEREVALKIVHQVDHADTELMSRFEREMRLCARLQHPGLVVVFDGIHEEHGSFLVMEYVEGPTLDTVLKLRQSLPWQQVAAIGLQLAEALTYLHDNGVVHRDVKPGNILLAPGGSTKLTDFGLSKGAQDVTLTIPGEIMGTPEYIPPEVFLGEGFQQPGDVWSLGCLLFRMLTGRPILENMQPTRWASLITSPEWRPTPPGKVVAGLPPELSDLVTKLLTRDRSARPSMKSVTAQLRRLLRSHGYEGAEDVLEPEWHRKGTVIRARSLRASGARSTSRRTGLSNRMVSAPCRPGRNGWGSLYLAVALVLGVLVGRGVVRSLQPAPDVRQSVPAQLREFVPEPRMDAAEDPGLLDDHPVVDLPQIPLQLRRQLRIEVR